MRDRYYYKTKIENCTMKAGKEIEGEFRSALRISFLLCSMNNI